MMFVAQSPFQQFGPRPFDDLEDALAFLSNIYDATGQVGTLREDGFNVPLTTTGRSKVVRSP